MVTPIGATYRSSADAWQRGEKAGRRTLPEFAGTSLADCEVASLPDFNASERLGDRRMMKFMSGASVLGCLAAKEASQDAEISSRFQPERIGLYAGAGLAAATIDEVSDMIRASIDDAGRFSCQLLGGPGLRAASPLLSFKILPNMPACLISILECIKGPNLLFTPWEGQTGAALLEAWQAVASGEVDCALAGAADKATHPATCIHLKQAQLLQDGEIPAPGAAYLVLESEETAVRDGQRIHARIKHMELSASNAGVSDPLAERIGRTFAAAPAILMALACAVPNLEVAIRGVDQQEFRAELEVAT
jgi:3-oxoacyl-(acyl-carrier-protein) synthase